MDINSLTLGQIKEIKSLVNGCGDSSNIMASAIGKFVIVRSSNEGINAGYLELADETGCKLKDAIRIWYHKPKDSKMAWYEGVAISGLHSDSKTSVKVASKYIVERYSITECTQVAKLSIQEHNPHES